MSRIGKQPISIPEKTTVEINGNVVVVKGPKGELSQSFPSQVQITIKDQQIEFSPKNPKIIFDRALWGTVRSIVANMVTGVNEGFSKQLEVQGVGYKVNMKGKDLVIDVGFSHPVDFKIPAEIEAVVDGNNITVSGINKELVGQVAAEIRKIRKPEPYKGKGIRYKDEYVRRKAGKVVKSGE